MTSGPSDPELWALAVCAMADQGIREGTARAFLGLCLKAWNEEHVRAAVLASLGKADFKAYCKAILSNKPPRKRPPSPQLTLVPPAVDPEAARAAYQAHRGKLRGMLKR